MRDRIGNRRVVAALAVAITLALVAVGAMVAGNDFRFTQRPVSIPGPGGLLDGVLTLPREGRAAGLVVMVHGDGAVDATHGDLYAPWFEAAADAGYATLSWNKPGVGGSPGDWLEQSMTDRAAEVDAALQWAHQRGDVPTGTIVVWGASQAGWVLPKVVASREDIDGVVAVGTAINWLRQGRYHLLAELDHEGVAAEERERVIADSDRTRQLLAGGATYGQYRAVTTNAEPMSAERWAFVERNFRADASHDLRAAAQRDLPVRLIVGVHDRNVDVAETKRVYREVFGSRLTVGRFEAAHSTARPVMEDVALAGIVTGTVWPRALFAPGVLDSYRSFLAGL